MHFHIRAHLIEVVGILIFVKVVLVVVRRLIGNFCEGASEMTIESTSNARPSPI